MATVRVLSTSSAPSSGTLSPLHAWHVVRRAPSPRLVFRAGAEPPSNNMFPLKMRLPQCMHHFLPSEWSTGCTAAEAQLLASMSTLTQLRSLDLRLLVDPDACSPDTVRPHATCLACLGALTALTRLRLELSDHYVPAGDSWRKRCEEGEEHEAWEEVRGAQRTSLLSALRRMPQLRQLRCSELWLRPSEAASLTALTGLHLGGLLAPPAAAAPSVNVTAAEDTARSPAGALPPQLRMLTLAFGASPSTLAALQPPPSLTELDASCICFGMSDVSPDGRVLPKAVQDFRSAVHLLAPLLPRKLRYPFYILADCGPRPMGPPEAGPRGHVQWMRELAVLDTGSLDLTLKGVQLRVGELACLASALPKVQVGLCARAGCLQAVEH